MLTLEKIEIPVDIMGHIKFKLEDGNALACNYVDHTNFIEFEHQDAEGKSVFFKLHKIQVRALLKAVNEPLKLGLDLNKKMSSS